MSNKIVPQIYRQIIDDVMAHISVDFDEYGMEETVLENLQTKWELKLLETKVADFVQAPQSPSASPEPEAAVAGPSGLNGRHGLAQAQEEAFGYNGAVAAGGTSLALPGGLVLPGIGANGGGSANGAQRTGAGGSKQGMQGQGQGQGQGDVRVKQEVDDTLRLRGGAPTPDPLVKAEPNAAGLLPGDEVIDSDLDDSDDDGQAGAEGEEDTAGMDIVFCVYDKVARVKNKWKTTFKDGLVHINGKDYLFTKCTGEFEW